MARQLDISFPFRGETSGTTGTPKVVVVSEAAAYARLDYSYRTVGGKENLKSVCCNIPDKSVYADIQIKLPTSLVGGEWWQTSHERPMEQVLIEERPETVCSTPFYLMSKARCRALKKHDFSFVKTVTMAGGELTNDMMQTAMEIFPNAVVRNMYGLTEIGCVSTIQGEMREGSVGVPYMPHRINDRGILELYCPEVYASHYEYAHGVTMPMPITDDGWYITGDRAEIREDGVHLFGRDPSTK